ncbi:MAG: two-component system response regulator [Planctomycetes bacterium GWF2_41_51]|nr:MAG: two-component system response regulator [Planctomycetes bacterium GWF2_41_51]HBG28140.1 two-component system response regulator [Phycisphaerales bacterium]
MNVNPELEIVIVEDNPNDAELLMRIFKKHNMVNNIVLLKDGEEAMDYFFGENGAVQVKPRVVILDLKLPKVNGIEILRKFKSDQRTKETPVVILTSSREEKDLKDAYSAGVNSYVIKPIKFADFAKVVSDLQLYWMLMNKPPVR